MPDTSDQPQDDDPCQTRKKLLTDHILFMASIARQPIKEKGTFYFLLTTFVFF